MGAGERRNILASTPLNYSGFHVCSLCAVSDCSGEFVWRIKREGEKIEKFVFSKELKLFHLVSDTKPSSTTSCFNCVDFNI